MSSLGSIKKNIRKLEKPKRPVHGLSPTQQLVKLVHSEMGIIATTPPHPMKYPRHAVEAKGSVYRGLCNTTACDGFPANHYNLGTYGYYCAMCAHGINGRRRPLCSEVDHSLSHAEMDERYRGFDWSRA